MIVRLLGPCIVRDLGYKLSALGWWNMMRTACLWNSLFILFLFTGALLQAGDVPIMSITASETQIVIQYVATSFLPCTISVTDEGSGTNPPRDVDPTLFPNANIDLYRTTASGFRWP